MGRDKGEMKREGERERNQSQIESDIVRVN